MAERRFYNYHFFGRFFPSSVVLKPLPNEKYKTPSNKPIQYVYWDKQFGFEQLGMIFPKGTTHDGKPIKSLIEPPTLKKDLEFLTEDPENRVHVYETVWTAIQAALGQ